MINRILKRISAFPPLQIALKNPRVKIYRPRMIDEPVFMKFGNGVTIRENAWLATIPFYAGISYQPKLIVQDNVYIGRYACITCVNNVEIGEGCVLSEHVYIADSAHGVDPFGGPIMHQPLVSRGPVRIGARSFIGYGARILPGVEIGKNCVVGANAVVTKSFPEYTMIAGVPARAIKRFNHDLSIWEPIIG
jgi:acetyltransferase-like isoleucine patch superfamily enzyme